LLFAIASRANKTCQMWHGIGADGMTIVVLPPLIDWPDLLVPVLRRVTFSLLASLTHRTEWWMKKASSTLRAKTKKQKHRGHGPLLWVRSL